MTESLRDFSIRHFQCHWVLDLFPSRWCSCMNGAGTTCGTEPYASKAMWTDASLLSNCLTTDVMPARTTGEIFIWFEMSFDNFKVCYFLCWWCDIHYRTFGSPFWQWCNRTVVASPQTLCLCIDLGQSWSWPSWTALTLGFHATFLAFCPSSGTLTSWNAVTVTRVTSCMWVTTLNFHCKRN